MGGLIVSSVMLSQPDTPIPFTGPWFDYVLTPTQTYLHAQRKGLELCVPYGLILPAMDGAGLADAVDVFVRLSCGVLPADHLEKLRDMARTPPGQLFAEMLFYLIASNECDSEDGVANVG